MSNDVRTGRAKNLLWSAGLALCAVFYIAAGANHFINEAFYLKIMPSYLPWHSELVAISGIAEIVLGLGLLVNRTRRWAAYGIIALLIAVFPANIYAFQNQHLLPAPGWAHLLRLPLQGVLIAWAWLYTRRDRAIS